MQIIREVNAFSDMNRCRFEGLELDLEKSTDETLEREKRKKMFGYLGESECSVEPPEANLVLCRSREQNNKGSAIDKIE